MSDKERVINYILQFSPGLIEDSQKEFQRYVKDEKWNRSIMGLTKLKDLIALQKYCFEQWEKLNPNKGMAKMDDQPAAPKIDIEVEAKGTLAFSIRCWEDNFNVKTNINEYSQLVCWQVVYNTLKAAIDKEYERLEKKLPLSDGMTKTQFQKHIDSLNLVQIYLHDQFFSLREKMVAAKKAKMQGKQVPAKKKSNIVIAPANAKLPPIKK